MREFKEGDKVKVISHSCSAPCRPCPHIGKIGTIKEMNYKYGSNKDSIYVYPFDEKIDGKTRGCSGFTLKDLVLVRDRNKDEIIYE